MNSKSILSLLLLSIAGVCQRPFANQPVSALSGTVLAVDGSPIRGEIMAYQMLIQNGEAHPIARCSATIGPDGSYACPVIPAGRYMVLVRPDRSQIPASNAGNPAGDVPIPPSGGTSTGKAPLLYPITFYPDRESLSEADALWLKPGVDGVANIVLHSHPATVLTGTIPSKPPKVSAPLSLHTDTFDLPTHFEVEYQPKTGRFIAENIPLGEYLFQAYWFVDGTDHHASARVTGGGTSPKDIVLQEDVHAEVRGTVHLQDGVTAELPTSIELECGPWGDKHRYTAKVDERENFAFPSIPTGDCNLHLASQGKLYVRSVAVKGLVQPRSRIVVGSSSSLKMEIEASNKEGAIRAAVAGADSDTGVVAQSLESGEYFTAQTDSTGNFVLPEVIPGSYRLFAWTAFKDAEYKNPAWLRRFENDGTTLNVQPGQTANVELSAIAAQ